MQTMVAGWVLRSADFELTAHFYRELGLTLTESVHGNSPLHFAMGPLVDAVVEIYPSTTLTKDTLLLSVSSIEEALRVVTRFGIAVATLVHERSGYRFVSIVDPDGRDVLLIEKMKP